MTLLFVTGTDTGVGKTTVACAMLAAMREKGVQVRGIKPIESGCEERDRELRAADAERLATAAAHAPEILFRYSLPLAPKAAAIEGGVAQPDLDRCVAHVRDTIDTSDTLFSETFTLVEGAGGLLVPLSGDLLVADLAAMIRAPLIIVARDGLGTINHTAMTIECAQRRGLTVAAFLFSDAGDTSEERASANAQAIVEMTGANYGGRLARLADETFETLARAGHALPFIQAELARRAR